MIDLSVIEKDGFRLQKISRDADEIILLKFRHKIFREQLRWVAESEDGLDLDEYDGFSDNYAVFNEKGEIVGSVRLTPGDFPFMVEREFSRLLPDLSAIHKGKQAAEITRFAVGMSENGIRHGTVFRLLYFALYHWACAHQVRWMYFVVEPPFFRHICRLGFPAFPVGEALPLDRGVLSMAGFLDWEMAMPGFIRWLQKIAEVPVVTQAQSHEFDYSH